jgi:hypothetical protein
MVIMTEPTADNRPGELSKRVDFGFEQTNQRLRLVEQDVRALRTEMNQRFDTSEARFGSVDTRFDTIDARFDRLQHLMIRLFAGTLGTVIAGVIVTVVTVLLHS